MINKIKLREATSSAGYMTVTSHIGDIFHFDGILLFSYFHKISIFGLYGKNSTKAFIKILKYKDKQLITLNKIEAAPANSFLFY